MIKILYLTLACFLVVEAQVPFLGRCPAIVPKQNFEPSRYLGKWYESEKYFAIFELGGKCITAQYTDKSNGVIGVFNKQINVITNKESTIEGTATLTGAPNEAKLSVVFPSVPFGRAAPYWVLDTDYTTYSVVYSCTDLFLVNTRIIWILTRDRIPSASTLQTAYSVIDRYNLSRKFLLKTDHANCPASY